MEKAGERVVPQKARVFLFFKMADESMSQRALPEVMSQRYLKSAIYPSQCNVEKTTEMAAFYDRFQPSAGPR